MHPPIQNQMMAPMLRFFLVWTATYAAAEKAVELAMMQSTVVTFQPAGELRTENYMLNDTG